MFPLVVAATVVPYATLDISTIPVGMVPDKYTLHQDHRHPLAAAAAVAAAAGE